LLRSALETELGMFRLRRRGALAYCRTREHRWRRHALPNTGVGRRRALPNTGVPAHVFGVPSPSDDPAPTAPAHTM
jgi:hypothetical protein